MDADRFDSIVRTLTQVSPRRSLVRSLGSIVLAGALTRHLRITGDAKKKKNNKKKKGKTKGECKPNCGGGTICCAGRCITPVTDRNNCGGCGVTCGAGQFCNNGTCAPCEFPLALCTIAGEERCVDLQNDRDNCGSCGNICPRDPEIRARDRVCKAGVCACPASECQNLRCCPAGYVCVSDGVGCCPSNFPVHCPNNPADGKCCPAGHSCGGTCGLNCCRL